MLTHISAVSAQGWIPSSGLSFSVSLLWSWALNSIKGRCTTVYLGLFNLTVPIKLIHPRETNHPFIYFKLFYQGNPIQPISVSCLQEQPRWQHLSCVKCQKERKKKANLGKIIEVSESFFRLTSASSITVSAILRRKRVGRRYQSCGVRAHAGWEPGPGMSSGMQVLWIVVVPTCSLWDFRCNLKWQLDSEVEVAEHTAVPASFVFLCFSVGLWFVCLFVCFILSYSVSGLP